MKLDFVVPGFSKCATTSLCALLADHPGLFIPENKEPNYFAHRKTMGWDWYVELFDDAKEDQLWGDGSTTYSSDEFADSSRDKILKLYPDVRFIFIARDPVKRLESSFRQFHDVGYKYGLRTPFDIGEALQTLPNMIADSRYWTLINKYRDHVPDSRIHVLFVEDFKRDPATELKRCFAFLGVDPDVSIPSLGRQLNAGSTKYYDTKVMQFIHRNRWTNRIWWKMKYKKQESVGRSLGLRRPITKPVTWTPDARQFLLDQLGDEVRSFLDFYGKPVDFWGVEAWANQAEPIDRAAA